MDKIAIIADDLTGATDTGVQFRNYGCKTAVALQSENLNQLVENNEVIVVSTESRSLPAVKARKLIREFIPKLKNAGVTRFFKKIDSTLRGNLGAEIEEMLDSLEKKAAFIIPAFPDNQRVTIDGYQFVKGIPLAETEIANDLLTPVNSSYIPDIIGEQSKRNIEIINKEDINDNLPLNIKNKIEAGTEFFVFDSQTKNDIKNIMGKLDKIEEDYLLIGCAGLAQELSVLWDVEPGNIKLEDIESKNINSGTIESEKNSDIQNNINSNKDGKIAVLAGSVRDETIEQINFASTESAITLLKINSSEILAADQEADKVVSEEIKRVVDQAILALNQDKKIIISLAKIKVSRKKADIISDSKKLLDCLKCVFDSVLEKFDFKGLVMTGGDTAVSICNLLDVHSIRILKEISPGIPAGLLQGGRLDKIKIVTKAGAFGKKDDILKAIEYLDESL